jgi:hypothetical protein
MGWEGSFNSRIRLALNYLFIHSREGTAFEAAHNGRDINFEVGDYNNRVRRTPKSRSVVIEMAFQ